VKHAGSGEGRRRWFRKGGGPGADETPTVDVAARLALIDDHRHAVAAAKAGAAPEAAEPAVEQAAAAPPVAEPSAREQAAATQTAAAPVPTASAPAAAAAHDLAPEHLEAARAELDRLMAEHRASTAASLQQAAGAEQTVDLASSAAPAETPVAETPWWVAVDEDEQALAELDVAPEQLDELVLVHQEPEGDDEQAEQAEEVVDVTTSATEPWYAGLRSDDVAPEDTTIDLRGGDDRFADSDDPDDVLARLGRLREAGLLSADEYEQERRSLAERA
jgi:hypothetical protein